MRGQGWYTKHGPQPILADTGMGPQCLMVLPPPPYFNTATVTFGQVWRFYSQLMRQYNQLKSPTKLASSAANHKKGPKHYFKGGENRRKGSANSSANNFTITYVREAMEANISPHDYQRQNEPTHDKSAPSGMHHPITSRPNFLLLQRLALYLEIR